MEASSGVDSQFRALPEKQLSLAELLRAQKIAADRVASLEEAISTAKLMEAINSQAPNFEIVDRPQIVGVTVTSRRPKLLSAALMAVVFATLTFFGLDKFDPRLRRISPVLDQLPLPVIGWFPHLSPHTRGEVPEPIHRLRLSLRNWISDKCRQFVVTSSDGGDGKSTVAASLAMSLPRAAQESCLLTPMPTVPASISSLNVLCRRGFVII